MENDFEVFAGKSLSDIFKEIHESTAIKHELILQTIKDLKEYITTADSVIMFAPIIKDYVDILIRCDEQNIKLATIIQRIMSAKAYSGLAAGDGFSLTTEERDELIKIATKDLDMELNILSDKSKQIINTSLS